MFTSHTYELRVEVSSATIPATKHHYKRHSSCPFSNSRSFRWIHTIFKCNFTKAPFVATKELGNGNYDLYVRSFNPEHHTPHPLFGSLQSATKSCSFIQNMQLHIYPPSDSTVFSKSTVSLITSWNFSS